MCRSLKNRRNLTCGPLIYGGFAERRNLHKNQIAGVKTAAICSKKTPQFARFFVVTLGHDDAIPNGSNFTFVCDPESYSNLGLDMKAFPFCDKSLSYDVRASDLVKQMTLSEKVLQLGNTNYGNTNYGVRRLGLLKYEWWSEALHGVSKVGPGTFFDDVVPGSTSFPTVITSAAAFNESLWKTIGRAVSMEARLTYWSPNIIVGRDPRWGRAIETPGEDPFVVGKYAANYVRGLEDVEGTENSTDLNSRPLKVSSCCKHYAAYDVDNWKGVERYSFDARVAEQDMVETFLRPFEMCVKEGDVSSIMCSYNRVDGIPCRSKAHEPNHQRRVGPSWIREADIDRSLKYLYVVLMRLGFFDGNPQYNSLGKKDVCSEANVELAREAVREGTVLLKNVGETLPLDSNKIKTLAVIGPHANATAAMIGNYAGLPCKIISPLDALLTYGEMDYQAGCGDTKCKNGSLIFPATQAAAKADVTIIVAGIDLSIEAESLDRDDLLLPGNQTQLINQVANAAKGPVVLVA
ncbi:hypothetical protein Tsubulata_005835 [Turnera subulata]|uniref:Glycoside hydrolase family 3 N-terminal domain-containing protein n=1 Tax=Turnera subulata TaxID=218843 RepID=A0A9Q0JRN3_9ROSI|nr:hypothetical protein Tsubulata_005835 [Turnera subulata]